MSQTNKFEQEYHKQKGQDNHATYLHFKHNYGWLDGFTNLYNAYINKLTSIDMEMDIKKADAFFKAYVKNIGLEPEMIKRKIDDRQFSLTIHHKVDIGGIIKNPTVYESLYAGELLLKAPDLVAFVRLANFVSVTYENTLETYTLTLLED